MKFDPNGQMKLVFKPVRALTEPELRTALALRDHPDTQKAITMTVSQADRDESDVSAPAPMVAPPAQPKAEPTPEPKATKVEAEEVKEPTKVVKKSTPAAEPAEKADLSDIVGDWDD
jgi:hypothetical protein